MVKGCTLHESPNTIDQREYTSHSFCLVYYRIIILLWCISAISIHTAYCLQQMKRNFWTAALTSATISHHSPQSTPHPLFVWIKKKTRTYISCWVMDTPFSTPPVHLSTIDSFLVRDGGLYSWWLQRIPYVRSSKYLKNAYNTEHNNSSASSISIILYSGPAALSTFFPRVSFIHDQQHDRSVESLFYLRRKNCFLSIPISFT